MNMLGALPRDRIRRRCLSCLRMSAVRSLTFLPSCLSANWRSMGKAFLIRLSMKSNVSLLPLLGISIYATLRKNSAYDFVSSSSDESSICSAASSMALVKNEYE